jgi:hypothetical protein
LGYDAAMIFGLLFVGSALVLPDIGPTTTGAALLKQLHADSLTRLVAAREAGPVAKKPQVLKVECTDDLFPKTCAQKIVPGAELLDLEVSERAGQQVFTLVAVTAQGELYAAAGAFEDKVKKGQGPDAHHARLSVEASASAAIAPTVVDLLLENLTRRPSFFVGECTALYAAGACARSDALYEDCVRCKSESVRSCTACQPKKGGYACAEQQRAAAKACTVERSVEGQRRKLEAAVNECKPLPESAAAAAKGWVSPRWLALAALCPAPEMLRTFLAADADKSAHSQEALGTVLAAYSQAASPAANLSLLIAACGDCVKTMTARAIASRSADVVRLVLDAGADPSTGLCQAQNPAIAELLLARGADVNVACADGASPIFNATAETYPLLKKHGVKLATMTASKYPALLALAAHGVIDGVRDALSAGVPVDVATPRGITALSVAAADGNLELVRALLKAGAKPNAVDSDGESPLHCARRAPRTARDAVIALLVEAGADPNLRDKSGKSARDYAGSDAVRLFGEPK